jgi:deazaflavin-dependent oxidoreductase (nitroreductase family)
VSVAVWNSIGNGAMKALLRSPAHSLVSGAFMLITVTGRKTGRRYTTPVNYVQDGELLTVLSWRERSWWRNVRGGAPVTVRLRGKNRSAFACVAAEGRRVGPAVRDYFQRLRHRRMSDTEATAYAEDKVILEVRLDAGDG